MRSSDISRIRFRTTNVTILGLGRGVQPDGSLSSYGEYRVEETLRVARQLMKLGLTVKIIWTGGASRKQVATNSMPARSEGEAMLAYATCHLFNTEGLEQEAETTSITTVENMANCARRIGDATVIVVTDTLHYKWKRVQIIGWLTFPSNEVVYVSIKRGMFGLKREIAQLASALILLLAMAGVRRGDTNAIMRRQRGLERLFGVR